MSTDEQCSKTISLPDMTVAFAALSPLFGNHTVLATKQNASPKEYDQQYKKFVDALERLRKDPTSSKLYTELRQLLTPVFSNFYLNLILNGYPVQAALFLEEVSSDINDANLLNMLSGVKSEEHIRQSKEVSQLLSHRTRLSLSLEVSEYLVKLLEANKLWLIYAAISSQVFVEQLTVHEVDTFKTRDYYYQERKEDAPCVNSSNGCSVTDFESAAAAVRKLSPCPPPIRLLTFADGSDSSPTFGQLSQSGNYCAFARANSRVLVLPAVQKMDPSISSHNRIELATFGNPLSSMAFANDDRIILAASDCDVIYWRGDWSSCKSTSQCMASRIATPSSLYGIQPVWVVAVSPLDLFFANGCNDSTMNLFDLSNIHSSSSLVRVFFDLSPSSGSAPVSAIAFHPNCAYLACGHSNGSVVMWDINDAAPVRRFVPPSALPIAALRFTPDGTRLLSVDDSGVFSTWDLRTGLATPSSSMSTGVVRPASCMPVSADSSLVCIGGVNKLMVLPVIFNSQETPPPALRLPRLNVLDADFRLGNILHVLAYKAA